MIRLLDNSLGEVFPEASLAALFPWAGLPLKQLLEEHPSLLVFPNCLGAFGDNWDDEFLYQISGKQMLAGNVAGFFSVNGEQIQIQLRFDEGNARQFFLHYMLKRILGINLLHLPTASEEEPIWDFVLCLFPYFLKKALHQGILRVYRVFSYNDNHVRGAVDVARHLRQNLPFQGCICYRTRELSADNPVIQLIRHAIEVIRIHPWAGDILTLDSEMRKAVQTIVEQTPDFRKQDAARVIAKNLRPVSHPYFTEYFPLQTICLKILRHEKISYGEEKERIHGLVFKAEWLWEEYLSVLLAKCGICHSRNSLRYSPTSIYLYRDHLPVYPDFYDEYHILDAKYKHLEKGIPREDRYQLISYLHIRKANAGYLLYPDNHAPAELMHIEGELNGYGGKVGSIAFPVPLSAAASSFEEYQRQMQAAEEKFIQCIQQASVIP